MAVRIALSWCASRLLLAAVVVVGAVALGAPAAQRTSGTWGWLAERFTWWDSWHYVRIAEQGYLPPGLSCCDQAFFPGYPALMAVLAPLFAGSVIAAGLVLSLLAGAVAAVLLHRLGELQSPGSGRWAVVYLAVAPFGIFLSAVYTESLFLSLSLAAWLLGQRRRWALAGLAAAGACTVRVNGLFLVMALAVTYAMQMRADGRRRPAREVLALGLGPLAVLAHFGFLAVKTGDPVAWHRAQSTGWVREAAWPWEGLASGWQAATSATSTDLVISRWADLLAVLAGGLLLLALALLRRWDQAVLIALNLAVLVWSTMLTSSVRYALMWFPAYLLLGELSTRPRWGWLRWAVPAVCLPLLVLLSLEFATHRWVG
ncbi:MAG TPA: mannosyltransferase family protein [Dermatophilaceae bacterium]|nr:mannosyltransferase family protein [Dermatophilaceae bacterium]